MEDLTFGGAGYGPAAVLYGGAGAGSGGGGGGDNNNIRNHRRGADGTLQRQGSSGSTSRSRHELMHGEPSASRLLVQRNLHQHQHLAHQHQQHRRNPSEESSGSSFMDPLLLGLDPLAQEDDEDDSTEEEPAPQSRPGVQFCQTHDRLTAKLAAFGKEKPCPSSYLKAAPPPSPLKNEIRIEIAPGLTARLRGANETWRCIENDYFVPVTCLCCATDLCCILDASFVLCPACRVVSPLNLQDCGSNNSSNNNGGVGIGFTVQELQDWQYEILCKRRQN